MKNEFNQTYWSELYKNNETGWDIGHVSTPLKTYIDQLTDKSINILIPGGGNSYEAEYLFLHGFKNVYVIDLAQDPLQNLKKRVPNFPSKNLIRGDFFELNQTFDLIFEQTFFCAISPTLRAQYVQKMHNLLNNNGKLVGLLFTIPLRETPPFGGSKEEYQALFSPYFTFNVFEEAYNSIKPRQGNELFINFTKQILP